MIPIDSARIRAERERAERAVERAGIHQPVSGARAKGRLEVIEQILSGEFSPDPVEIDGEQMGNVAGG